MSNESNTSLIDAQGKTVFQNTINPVRKPLKKKKIDSEAPKMDMLAFASVMTIMLAFFIMLSSYAGKPEKDSAEEAIMSLKEALENFGISRIIFGSSDSISNLDFELSKIGGPHNTERPWVKENVYSNTIDKEVEIDYIRKRYQIVFPTEVVFVKGFEISPTSKLYLNNLIKVIKNRECKITVGGYTSEDFIPTDDYPTSWQLSAEYANAVTTYFNDVGNIDYKRLTAIGYGKYRPLLGEESSFNTKANNRISIIISDK
ncbi:MAG: H+-driven flagellar motor component MotB [Candidatus Scalindua rubra]|uniref:H+-driven flagellar motor component MotB n=1 Tax=Candidatus Scalindua rubra TaxID=1872076 RepID=A0A1E3X3K3_9BACT|nr:MAG: H+-driven flagellar motor component MotB [Candidatus Scalindua rubra]